MTVQNAKLKIKDIDLISFSNDLSTNQRKIH